MHWIGLTSVVNMADVHVSASSYGDFHLRFNRETCDQLCPNNRRMILGIDGDRLYFKEVRNSDGYKYCIRSNGESGEIGTATLHNHNRALCEWARNGSTNKNFTGFDSNLLFDDSLKMYYIERPKGGVSDGKTVQG